MFISVSHHARMRLEERYGLTATLGLIWHLAKFLEEARPSTAGGCTAWAVPYRDHVLHFVYDARRRQVVTFLPSLSALPERAHGCDHASRHHGI